MRMLRKKCRTAALWTAVAVLAKRCATAMPPLLHDRPVPPPKRAWGCSSRPAMVRHRPSSSLVPRASRPCNPPSWPMPPHTVSLSCGTAQSRLGVLFMPGHGRAAPQSQAYLSPGIFKGRTRCARPRAFPPTPTPCAPGARKLSCKAGGQENTRRQSCSTSPDFKALT